MTKQQICTLLLVLEGVIILALSFFLWRTSTQEPDIKIETKTDTVTIHDIDTLFVRNIEYKEVYITDTIHITDTVLYREYKHYSDSIADIYISGIEPELDSIRYYIPRDTIIVNNVTTITKTKRKGLGQSIGVGLQVGYGFTLTEPYRPTPYVGVGVSYQFGYHW